VPPRVSIVVPVYNVAAYLETCLESLAQQTMRDLEVVMVDDGSTDASPEIAERFAARDPRFRLVRQANAGLGAARNTGTRHSTGEFIAFVDSDDVVPPHAYELLLGTLDKTGSDFASGNVSRLTSAGTTKAAFLAKAFARTRRKTHITRFPALIADRTAWNKLFRRSFWDAHGFRFPVGVYYEDTPVTLPAHYLARSVDVIEQPVYLWRMREGGDLSITQRRTEPKTLRDRVAAVDSVSRFLAGQGLLLSKAAYDRSVLAQDLRFFLEVLPFADDDYRRLFLDLANDFIDRVDDWALDQTFAIDRLKWQLVRRRALPELLEVLRFEEEELASVPPLRRGRFWYGDYPFRQDDHLRIPDSVYRLKQELTPVARIEDMRWEDRTLRIEGFAYISLLGAPEPNSQTVELVAREHNARRRRVHLDVESVYRPDLTAAGAQVACLDWSGFVATLDVSRLMARGRWRKRTWDIGVTIRAGGVTRTSWRPEPAPLHPTPFAELSLDGRMQAWAGRKAGGFLTVGFRGQPAHVRSYAFDAGVLQLEGECKSVSGPVRLRASRRIGGAILEYPAYVDRSLEQPTFVSRLPVGDLVHVDADEGTELQQDGDGADWDLSLVGDGRFERLALDCGAGESTWTLNGREIAVRRSRSGKTVVAERSFKPVVRNAEWGADGSLRIEGTYGGPPAEYDLLLAARARGETLRVPLAHDAPTGRFWAELSPGTVSSGAGPHPLGEGQWQLLVARRGGSGLVTLSLGGALLDRLPLVREIGLKRYQLGVLESGSAALVVEPDLTVDERGGFNQRRLRTDFYPAKRAGGLRDAVVYDCFGGCAFADSPRAIHDELVRRGAPFEHLWVVRDAAFDVPDTASVLREGSRAHYEALARARYVVANDHWPRWFSRRSEQACLQTWHGAPLKRLGHDLADRPRAFRAYRRALAERPENWQFLVSPGPSATPILKRAFPAAEILETGLPRTDRLLRPDRDRVAEAVRKKLGVRGRRVILYAPTYRDHLAINPGSRSALVRPGPTFRSSTGARDTYRLSLLLDITTLVRALGDEDVLLFRKHRRVRDVLSADVQALVVDVSDYPETTDLLLAADVLVTDYASSIVDFASTGRPILLYTPDLEAYRDEIRGFSIDFEGEAPGPLLETTAELIEALKGTDAVQAAYRERYAHFVATHCALADGHASSRVVDRVFRW
jgi:CDP-glycerol glycerophosphotransferase